MQKRTQLAIVDAFNHLIAEKPFEDISVGDIIEKAEVSRATFYRYFNDKYDVMNFNYKNLIDRTVKLEECASYRDAYRHLYSAGMTELRGIRGAFRSNGVNSFENYIYTYSRQTVVDITMKCRGYGLSAEEDLQLDVFCYGIVYMYKKWIMGAYHLTPDVAADKLYELMPATLKYYWPARKV